MRAGEHAAVGLTAIRRHVWWWRSGQDAGGVATTVVKGAEASSLFRNTERGRLVAVELTLFYRVFCTLCHRRAVLLFKFIFSFVLCRLLDLRNRMSRLLCRLVLMRWKLL